MRELKILASDRETITVQYIGRNPPDMVVELIININGTYYGGLLSHPSKWKMKDGRFHFKHVDMTDFHVDTTASPDQSAEFASVIANWLTEIGLLL